jgi:ATP-dependent Clp protease adaptor protein ClpS
MGSEPDPPGGGGGDSWTRREGGVAEKTRIRVARPPRFRVVLYNDDYTPMEFVVQLLESVFGKSPAESNQLMLRIHRSGSGVAGVYVLEVAETKVASIASYSSPSSRRFARPWHGATPI